MLACTIYKLSNIQNPGQVLNEFRSAKSGGWLKQGMVGVRENDEIKKVLENTECCRINNKNHARFVYHKILSAIKPDFEH